VTAFNPSIARTTMNYSTAIFLINNDVRAVAVSYEQDAEGKGIKPFITFKTFDPTVAVGDFVAIPTGTRHGMTVARVEEVDVEVELSFTGSMNWLVDRVDTSQRDAVEKMEAEAIATIKSAKKKAEQDKLRAELIADNPSLSALANIGGDTVQALPAE